MASGNEKDTKLILSEHSFRWVFTLTLIDINRDPIAPLIPTPRQLIDRGLTKLCRYSGCLADRIMIATRTFYNIHRHDTLVSSHPASTECVCLVGECDVPASHLIGWQWQQLPQVRLVQSLVTRLNIIHVKLKSHIFVSMNICNNRQLLLIVMWKLHYSKLLPTQWLVIDKAAQSI